MFRTMALALAGMVVVFFAVGSLLSDRWVVDSSRVVAATPAQVGAFVRDFGTWATWSSMNAELGPNTQRELHGDPGTVGHRIAWRGPQGQASLSVTAVGDDRLAYAFHVQTAAETTPRLGGTGGLVWRADADGCRVEWHDESTWDGLPGRWVGWFGALQERVRQIQATSLEGLQQALTKRAGAAPAAAGGGK
jgi:hypothetical protein